MSEREKIFIRVSPKLKAEWSAVTDRRGFSQNFVGEKLIEWYLSLPTAHQLMILDVVEGSIVFDPKIPDDRRTQAERAKAEVPKNLPIDLGDGNLKFPDTNRSDPSAQNSFKGESAKRDAARTDPDHRRSGSRRIKD